MAFTATLKSKQQDGDKIRVEVEYTDGTSVFSDSFTILDEAELKRLVRRKINQLTSTKVAFQDLIINEQIDVTDPAPTQAELDRQEFLSDYSKLQRINVAVNLGILTGNETFITNLINKIRTSFKPEYIDGI